MSTQHQPPLPATWRAALESEIAAPYFAELMAFVARERASHEVFPPEKNTFEALRVTALDDVRVLLLGQDPYPTPGHAHGLCFSVLPGVKPPASLRNIYKELHDDLGCFIPSTGYLLPWAMQGILMLNAVLTVRVGEPNSHKNKGWERFTDAVIARVNDRVEPVVFVLWGGYAQKKRAKIDERRHTVIAGAHPSPLSAKLWFGSRPFSKINAALRAHGQREIDWQIRDE